MPQLKLSKCSSPLIPWHSTTLDVGWPWPGERLAFGTQKLPGPGAEPWVGQQQPLLVLTQAAPWELSRSRTAAASPQLASCYAMKPHRPPTALWSSFTPRRGAAEVVGWSDVRDRDLCLGLCLSGAMNTCTGSISDLCVHTGPTSSRASFSGAKNRMWGEGKPTHT